jgi:hypothetical protein
MVGAGGRSGPGAGGIRGQGPGAGVSGRHQGWLGIGVYTD